MPPKKKKPQRNGFYFFMQDVMPDLRREGFQFRGLDEVVPLAHPRWKALTEKEKAAYENRAKQFKQQQRNLPNTTVSEDYQPERDTRIDAAGVRICDRIDQDQVKAQRVKEEHKWHVDHWPPEDDVMDYSFFLIGFESLSKRTDDEITKYLPCEMACVEFNLRSGIIKTLHKFLVPPAIPLGYRFACSSHSESTHQIPIEDFELAESDFKSIWQDLIEFVNPSRSYEFPPLYTMEDDCEMVSWSLNYLAQNAGNTNRLRKVFFLEGLLSGLHIHQNQPAPATIDLGNILNSSMFDYDAKTRCSYHDEKGIIFCALATCTKRCYIIANTLASIYGYELTSTHCPPRGEMTKIRVIQPNESSVGLRSLGSRPGMHSRAPRHQARTNNTGRLGFQDRNTNQRMNRHDPHAYSTNRHDARGHNLNSYSQQDWSQRAVTSANQPAPAPQQDWNPRAVAPATQPALAPHQPISRPEVSEVASGLTGDWGMAGASYGGPTSRQEAAAASSGQPIRRPNSNSGQPPLAEANKKPLRQPYSTTASAAPLAPLDNLASPQRMASSYFSTQPAPFTSLGRGRGLVASFFPESSTQPPPFTSISMGRGRGINTLDNFDSFEESFSSLRTSGSGDANYSSQ